MNKIALIYILTLIANTIDVLSYSIYIVGVKTKKLAISLALFQTVMIVSRVALYIQAPLLASLADEAILNKNVDELVIIFRNVIFMVSIGSLLGGVITPLFIDVFSSLTNYFERLGTIPKMLSSLILNIRKLPKKRVRMRGYKEFKEISFKEMPIGLIILNSVAIGVYSVGLLSSIYAGALAPEYRMTASQLSGMVVGGAAALFMIFVDPMIAVVTDQTLDGKRAPNYIKSLVFFLVIGDLIGTVLSQIMFIPLAKAIIYVIRGM